MSFVSPVDCYWCLFIYTRRVLLFFYYFWGYEGVCKYYNSLWFVDFDPRDQRHYCRQFTSLPKSPYCFVNLYFSLEWFQLVLNLAEHAISMLYFCIALHFSSRVWPVLDNSSPFTFWNKIRMESLVFFIVCPNSSLHVLCFFQSVVFIFVDRSMWCQYLDRCYFVYCHLSGNFEVIWFCSDPFTIVEKYLLAVAIG